MINRLVEHDSGRIRFAGQEIRSLPVLELRRRMGYADGYVAKFELNELSSVIEEVLDRSMKKIDGPLISRKQLA
jgi:ABC-type proline/glycine betaine transport system ATPase subunit